MALGGASGLFWEPGIWKPSGRGGVGRGPGRGPASFRPHTGPPSGAVALGPEPCCALSPASRLSACSLVPFHWLPLSCEMRSHNMQ